MEDKLVVAVGQHAGNGDAEEKTVEEDDDFDIDDI